MTFGNGFGKGGGLDGEAIQEFRTSKEYNQPSGRHSFSEPIFVGQTQNWID